MKQITIFTLMTIPFLIMAYMCYSELGILKNVFLWLSLLIFLVGIYNQYLDNQRREDIDLTGCKFCGSNSNKCNVLSYMGCPNYNGDNYQTL